MKRIKQLILDYRGRKKIKELERSGVMIKLDKNSRILTIEEIKQALLNYKSNIHNGHKVSKIVNLFNNEYEKNKLKLLNLLKILKYK